MHRISALRAERRSEERAPLSVWAESHDGHGTYFNLTSDISVHGARLSTPVPHPIGTKLKVRLEFPRTEERGCLAIRAVAQVVQVGDAPHPAMGLRFIAMPVEDLLGLRELLKHRAIEHRGAPDHTPAEQRMLRLEAP